MLRLQKNSGKTLYEQLYEDIREEIRTGKRLPGERLPSTRFLSDSLQVSRTTVDMAYGQLTAEGYLTAKPKSGYFVNATEGLYDTGMTAAKERARPAKKEPESAFRYDFSPTAIDMTHFPYATWKKITRNILVDAKSQMFALGEPQGDEELRRTICRYLHGSRGVNCEPEQLIIGAGNDFLLLLLEKLLGRHVPIAMEDPTYLRAYRIFRSFAYPISLIPLDEKGISVDKLWESGAQAAYVMPSHQYPTGISMPIGRRMELLGWAAAEKDRYLIEDDYDSEFRYKGRPLPSLQASDTAGSVIYLGTFSKAIAPAIRVSYMALPYPLLEKYRRECSFFSSTVSRIDQAILNEFIRDGYFERYLNKMRKQYRAKHDLLLGQIREWEADFAVSGENAGLHILLTDKRGRKETDLVRAAEKADVKVYGMEAFRVGEKDAQAGEQKRPATLILGYGGLSEDEILQGLKRLKEAWQ
ncbi:MAG: PLP-dependent aminotransferase family protein [Bacteroidales bacterium]|nr:PLP-dependent aminotransferase family protein [Bacteroidales bacterium]MCM1415624.1 PLP-dependent aminotransferase family protein [bacterium]MCM1422944.1 PLP-dependent aminotransferase family protein [bacterium]